MNPHDCAVIVSLFPAPFHTERPSFSPQREYHIPACQSVGKPVIFVVERQRENPYMGLDRFMPRTWEPKQVAEDVVNNVTSGLLGASPSEGHFPAVWVSEGAKYVNGEWVIPQEEILERLRAQDGMLRTLVSIARKLAQNKDEASITPVMRRAAEFLNIQGEEWQSKRTSESHKPCKFCQSIISASTVICPICTRVVDKARYDAIMAEDDARLAKQDAELDVPAKEMKLPPPPPNLRPQATAG